MISRRALWRYRMNKAFLFDLLSTGSVSGNEAELAKKNGGKYTCPLPEYVQPPIGKY